MLNLSYFSNPDCQAVFDRDVNGSFNILLKYLTSASELHPQEVSNLIPKRIKI
jgi:transposase